MAPYQHSAVVRPYLTNAVHKPFERRSPVVDLSNETVHPLSSPVFIGTIIGASFIALVFLVGVLVLLFRYGDGDRRRRYFHWTGRHSEEEQSEKDLTHFDHSSSEEHVANSSERRPLPWENSSSPTTPSGVGVIRETRSPAAATVMIPKHAYVPPPPAKDESAIAPWPLTIGAMPKRKPAPGADSGTGSAQSSPTLGRQSPRLLASPARSVAWTSTDRASRPLGSPSRSAMGHAQTSPTSPLVRPPVGWPTRKDTIWVISNQ